MTDKLTPPIYLELYTGPGLLAGHKYVLEGGQFTAVPMEEAARREAEAGVAAAVEQLAEEYEQTLRDMYDGPLTGIEAGPDAVHPKPPREGPGSAADDLVKRLRGRACDSWEICEQAADRIEAQAREIARLREALERAAKRFRWYEEIHASKTPPDDDKAKRNREFAEDCEAALARGGEHG